MIGLVRQKIATPSTLALVQRRAMSSGGISLAEEIKEMKKWKIITFLALPVCAVKAAMDLSHGEHHGGEAVAYPYLRIRSKAFPWGDNGLFEVKHEE